MIPQNTLMGLPDELIAKFVNLAVQADMPIDLGSCLDHEEHHVSNLRQPCLDLSSAAANHCY